MMLFGIDGFRKNWRRVGRAVFVGINEIVFTRVPWNRILLFWKKIPRCSLHTTTSQAHHLKMKLNMFSV
jgi:hypothetical protein